MWATNGKRKSHLNKQNKRTSQQIPQYLDLCSNFLVLICSLQLKTNKGHLKRILAETGEK